MKHWKTYIALIITYICMHIASIFVTIPLFQYFSNDASLTEQEMRYHGAAWSLFLTNFAAAIVFYLLVFRKKDFFKIFKEEPAPLRQTIIWGILAFFMALIGQMVAGMIEIEVFGIEAGSANTAMLSDIAKTAPIIIISIVIFAPLLEEMIFRRVLFGGLYTVTNVWIAAIVSAIIFAAVHNELEHILVYAAPALVFSFVYYKTKRLLAPIIGHLLMNGFVVVIQLNYDKIMELQEMPKALFAFFK